MTRKHFAMLVICAICGAVDLPSSFRGNVGSLNQADPLNRQIRSTVIKGETIDQVLGILTAEYGIPIGIELGDPTLTPRREIDLSLPETNVKNFLDSLVAKDPRYTWKLEGGVIHFRPVTGRDSLLTTLLDTKISHFAFTGGVTRYHIHNEVMNLPEIRSQLVVAGVDPMIFLNFGNMKKFEKEIFFDESNLTLRELLDRIIVKTDMKRWVLARWGENGEFITLKS